MIGTRTSTKCSIRTPQQDLGETHLDKLWSYSDGGVWVQVV
jgi:hypothetical protein